MNNRNMILLLALWLSTAAGVFAQTEKKAIYDPSLDGAEEITKLVKRAHAEKKHVLLQVGGNW
jgi:hypothetical protein